MFRLIIFTCFLGCILPVVSQTKTRALPEPCQVSQAPTFRGFSLGQTPKQINVSIPGFEEAYDEAAGVSNEEERLIVSSEPLFNKDDGRKALKEDYRDVDFIWHFFDEKVFQLVVKYNEFEPPNIQDFVKQGATRLQLPLTGWTYTDKTHANLKCNGFKIELWAGNILTETFERDVATITLTDLAAEAARDQSLRKEKDKERLEELEKLRLQRERKRVFKP